MSNEPSGNPALRSPEKQFSENILLAECFDLRRLMAYDEEGGFYFWPQVDAARMLGKGDQCGICTSGARLMAEKFGGFVAGYAIDPEDPQTLVGAVAFGHDFAVVGDFIVDWWGWEYEQSLESPVIHRAEGIALGKYKPERLWEVHQSQDFRNPCD